MTFKDAYNRTIKYYPSEIDISDGTLVGKDGGNFKILSKFWDNAELKTENEPEYVKLMVWGIFCALHKKAIVNFLKGIKTVNISELDMKYLKFKFKESLFHLNISQN